MPSSFVLVLGYPESLAISAATAAFLALRRRQWWWAAALGVALGAMRPVGILLALPAAVEAGRDLWDRRSRIAGACSASAAEVAARAAAVAGPVVGCLSYLVWAGMRSGDPLAPYRVQGAPNLRGPLVDPLSELVHVVARLDVGDPGHQFHFPWVVAAVAATVLLFRRWPVSYGVFAAAVLTCALTSHNLNSLERYALGAFPLVVAVAVWAPAALRRPAAILSGGLMAVYAGAAFIGAYVP